MAAPEFITEVTDFLRQSNHENPPKFPAFTNTLFEEDLELGEIRIGRLGCQNSVPMSKLICR
ncbi:MAG: hypothetical protein C4K49_08010 [Candidatus Thorarchaeota archaeon]|nr:MAG: hypothetical protein C4K49_08010 [Candidatus Thorarchaeota archaeon]